MRHESKKLPWATAHRELGPRGRAADQAAWQLLVAHVPREPGAAAGEPQPGSRSRGTAWLAWGAAWRRRYVAAWGRRSSWNIKKKCWSLHPSHRPHASAIALHDHHLQITANQFIQLGSKPMTSIVGLLPRRLFAFSTLIMLMGCGGISIVASAIAVWVSGHCRRGPCCTFQCG
jgi:hypothetical protein